MGILKNFRRGFATNSSSSHSFVYMKDSGGLGPENPGTNLDSDFGWQDFSLTTIREKLFYILVGKIGEGYWASDSYDGEDYENYGHQFPELSENDFSQAKRGYVDHDSIGVVSEEVARDPYSVVFGGNDNDGDSQLRAEAVRSGSVDWSRTEMLEEDYANISEFDEDGLAKLKEIFSRDKWTREYYRKYSGIVIEGLEYEEKEE